jgi:hypothetical protein
MIAHGYRTPKFILLRTFDHGVVGSHAYDTYYEVLPPDAGPTAVGQAVITALNASRRQTREEFDARSDGVRERGQAYEDELCARFRFRNRQALYSKMVCCMIFRRREHIEFSPTNRMRQRLENYSALSGKSVLVPVGEGAPIDAHQIALGDAQIEAFSRCTIAKPDWWGATDDDYL